MEAICDKMCYTKWLPSQLVILLAALILENSLWSKQDWGVIIGVLDHPRLVFFVNEPQNVQRRVIIWHHCLTFATVPPVTSNRFIPLLNHDAFFITDQEVSEVGIECLVKSMLRNVSRTTDDMEQFSMSIKQNKPEVNMLLFFTPSLQTRYWFSATLVSQWSCKRHGGCQLLTCCFSLSKLRKWHSLHCLWRLIYSQSQTDFSLWVKSMAIWFLGIIIIMQH